MALSAAKKVLAEPGAGELRGRWLVSAAGAVLQAPGVFSPHPSELRLMLKQRHPTLASLFSFFLFFLTQIKGLSSAWLSWHGSRGSASTALHHSREGSNA